MDRFQDLEDRINASKTDLNEMNKDLVSELNDLRNQAKQLEEKLQAREFYVRYSPYAFGVLEHLKERSGLSVLEWMLLETELVKEDSTDNDTEYRKEAKGFFKKLCQEHLNGMPFDTAVTVLRFVWSQGHNVGTID